MKYLYAHHCPDGLFYIGAGSLVRAGNVTRTKRQPHHWFVVAKHGPENIEVDILFIGDDAEVDAMEQEAIQLGFDLGHPLINRVLGKAGRPIGTKLSQATKDRIRASNLATMGTPEFKAKRSAASKAMYTPELRALRSEQAKEQWANEEKRKTLSQALSNFRWITNGTESRRLRERQRMPRGFHYGKLTSIG